MKASTIFATLFLGFVAVSVSFCTKENQSDIQTSQPDASTVVTGEGAGDRGFCAVTVQVQGSPIEVCGTQGNGFTCTSNGGVALLGINNQGNGSNVTYSIASPAVMKLTLLPNPPTANTTVRVSSAGGVKTYMLNPLNNTSADVTITNGCAIQ